MCTIARSLTCTPLLLLLLSATVVVIASAEQPVSNFETVHTSNAAILNRLGLAPLQIPDGHHKKRLAGPEPPGLSSQTRIHQPYSRRHGHRDSHVYIVKLPASPPYYTITKPHKSVKDEKVTKTGPNFPVGFQGNGKPAKIYHWNLPVVKKITEKKRLHTQLKMEQAKKKMDTTKKFQSSSTKNSMEGGHQQGSSKTSQDPARQENKKFLDNGKMAVRQGSPSKHVRNNDKRLSYPEHEDKKGESAKKGNNGNASNKTYRLDDSGVHRIHLTNDLHGSRNTAKVKKHRKKAAMSYYAPITGKSGSTSIHKNFPGNGKPKAFYVMEKSRKPVYYHPLLP
ncbi:PREDICTED: uncharacterized protein LOC108550179 [Eufriesea mexicana]|uniref:uncharacterized protein LOC108550179 n=1 Tax=Eufriesea mexicana TaxID=516756 RepID=UPI00083C01FD|nr:PREDICTED: uncharacterized protein LOC108550179 [Eufriesea mexicana]